MLRINRHSGREGCDGEYRSWETIEQSFKDSFERNIKANLGEKAREEEDSNCREFILWCKDNTSTWLIAKPKKLEEEKGKIDRKIDELQKELYGYLTTDDAKAKVKKMLNTIGNAYGYKHADLVELAGWLNVKTCPYCNMQYTMYTIVDTTEGEPVEERAMFQYDHFYPKSAYPMLSMSLYNLIPSCASCNQNKSYTKILGLEFHPYYSAIKDNLYFRVKDPLPLWVGKCQTNEIEIETVFKEGVDAKEYEKAFHVAALYKNHKDIAREVYARAYADTYYRYAKNFGFLGEAKLVERLYKGFYPDEDDIELRPLTKLQQDLWAQAKGFDKRGK